MFQQTTSATQLTKLILWGLLFVLPAAQFARAQETRSASLAWSKLETRQALKTRTVLRPFGEFSSDAEWTFLVIPGLGGTAVGDRFEMLCETLKTQRPQANVLLVDWTADASEKFLGALNPLAAARKIDGVAADVAAVFQEQQLTPATTTAIGESFGAYVAGRIGIELGGLDHILAFNAANELGGYKPLDLRQAACHSWSFQTYSPYDTLRPIAHTDLFLETPTGASHFAQHTHGMVWLATRLRAGDDSWLSPHINAIQSNDQTMFAGLATCDGEFQPVAFPRVRP
jgi:hypothetical protein